LKFFHKYSFFWKEYVFYLFRIYFRLKKAKIKESPTTQFMGWKKFNYNSSKANSEKAV